MLHFKVFFLGIMALLTALLGFVFPPIWIMTVLCVMGVFSAMATPMVNATTRIVENTTTIAKNTSHDE